MAPRDIADVGDHGRRGGVAAGAGADQGEFANRVRIDGDGVGHAHDLRDRGGARDHRGMDALLDPGRRALGDAQELDAVAEIGRHRQIERRDLGDALDIDRVRVDRHPQGEAGEQRQLVGGVVALDVEGRVRLRVTQALRVREAFGEGQSLRLHSREDVVAGAVEDARDARDDVAGERFA